MRTTSHLNIAPDDLATYRVTAWQRREQEQQAQFHRRELARAVARQAAELLRQQFGAIQVILFGSLAHSRWFTTTSDIDLAASGVAKEEFFTAVARLQDLSPLFRIDLVDLENCPPHLREAIDQEGQEL